MHNLGVAMKFEMYESVDVLCSTFFIVDWDFESGKTVKFSNDVPVGTVGEEKADEGWEVRTE
jgi:hypothetical protein